MSLTLGSLFDGIGGWLLAALHNGVKPVWASEIDEFPAAVTAHHFPEVKQLGDITKIDPDKLEPVDIICAGSPCQDLSVAGKRAGLEGERSGLFHTAIRLVHELRARTGSPRYFVWENVPGAFSSNKGLDFRAVLEEISETQIPMPKDNKWAESGYVEWGGTSSLAWRTLDAQYWGVPQRRKRIFLVTDFTGLTAGEILFEPEGVLGHSSESQGKGQDIAGNARGSVEGTSRASVVRMRSGCPGGGKGPLVSEERSLTLGCSNDQTVFAKHKAYSFDSLASNSMKSSNPHSGCRQVEISKCLDTTNPDPSKNQGGVAVCAIGIDQQGGKGMAGYAIEKCPTMASDSHGTPHAVCIAGNIIGRENKNGGHHLGIGDDKSFTLNTVDRHAVCYSMSHDIRSARLEANKADPLTATDYKDPPFVTEPSNVYCVGNGQMHQVELSDTVGALNTMHDQQCVMVGSSFGQYKDGEGKSGVLKANGGDAGGERNPNRRKVGCLAARDYKGVGSQYVDEGKLVIEDEDS